jgi:signal transduction histidine kinase
MLRALTNNLAGFRAQAIAFILALLVLTALVIFFINQRLERRTTSQVDEYFQSIILAMDIGYRSLAEGKYLRYLVNTPGSLPVDSASVIKHILVVDAQSKEIIDSTEKEDIGKTHEFGDLPAFAPGNVKFDAEDVSPDENRSVKFSIETDKGKTRNILIVISMKRLKRVKQAAERDRTIAFSVLGLILIIAIAVFSKRFTGPVTGLSKAAQQVTAGELDFNVPVSGPKEVSTLAATFNEMLAGLRRSRDLEEQLQRAERSAVVGRLASGIAHEIRNPLNFMNLSIDHLQAACAHEDQRRRAEFSRILTTIKEEITRLNRLVSNFLSYGRPARLKLRELDARAVIEEVGELVKAKAVEQGVQIHISANGAGAAATHIEADAEQIKTCFSNLMINAVQAMPDGGSLNVTLQPSQTHLRIEFADTGVGIGTENLEQIFEPYYSTKETGIGLGLPLTKKIIEEHGGQITVASEPGQGTTFTLTLPRGLGGVKQWEQWE